MNFDKIRHSSGQFEKKTQKRKNNLKGLHNHFPNFRKNHIRCQIVLSIFPAYYEKKGKSTLHSLIQVVEKIRNSIENKMYGCGIFINLKKGI